MQTFLMALRNLNRQKRRTILLGGAIAFGIFVVTVINGFAGSFVENVSENFSNLLAGHIFVEGVERDEDGEDQSIIRDDTEVLEAIEASGVNVVTLSKRSEFDGELIFQGNSIRQAIVGVDWGEEEFLRERLVLLEGSFDAMLDQAVTGHRNGIILSGDVAERLNVRIGDTILVKMRTVNGRQNVGEFRLAAVSYDPGFLGSISAYADISYVNELLTIAPGEYQQLGFFVGAISDIDDEVDTFFPELDRRVDVFPRDVTDEDENPVAALFNTDEEESWTGTRFRVFTLNDLLSDVDQIVDLLNGAALVILLILFVVIMVGITNTFRMILLERVREIGTMRALGMQRSGIRNLFLLEALLLALFGAAMGMVLAGLFMLIVSNIFLGLDSPIFILLKNGYLTFRLPFVQAVRNVAIVAGLTVFAAFFPTRKAALMPPVDALRSVA